MQALRKTLRRKLDAQVGKTRLRLCFAHPTEQVIREGVARLAEG